MIYYQKEQNGMPFNFDTASAVYGAIETKEAHIGVTYEDVIAGHLDSAIPKYCFIGTVEFMNAVFDRVDKTVRLPLNSNRQSRIVTLAEALQAVKVKPMFIKPVQIKQFTGFVHEGYNYSCLDNVPLDSKVYLYDVFDSEIVSEWRLYVHNNKITDSCCYDGGYRFTPNYGLADRLVYENMKSFPHTYTIDLAVLGNGSTVVVEYNDMWAIGNYGVPNAVYLEMLKDRYRQILSGK